MAFYELEPWGAGPADERAARIAWAALFPHVKRQDGQPFTPADVAITRDGDQEASPPEPQDDEAALKRFFNSIRTSQRSQRRRR